jgi:hypothetical protein
MSCSADSSSAERGKGLARKYTRCAHVERTREIEREGGARREPGGESTAGGLRLALIPSYRLPTKQLLTPPST